MKIPGMTISPSPRSDIDSPDPLGKSSLMGASMPFATLTITGVPNTQKMS